MPDSILRHVPGMAFAAPVPVLHAQTLTEHRFKSDYVANSRPCLIKGAVSHWPATRKWRDRDYFKSLCGPGEVHFWPHENHVTGKRSAPGRTSMPFAEAVERLHSGPEEVAAIGCNPGTAAMVADMGGFSFFTEAELAFSYPPFRHFIFRKAGTSWHYHALDETLMCQIVGTKKVGLLKAENPQRPVIDHIFYQEDYYEDPAAFDALGDETLPWLCADLMEGDALYIPPLWWHGVVVTSDGVGVTTPVSWRSPPHVIADSLRKMAAGRLDLNGVFYPDQFRSLLDAARKLGLEPELQSAWTRGVADRQISLTDPSGARRAPSPAWPPL